MSDDDLEPIAVLAVDDEPDFTDLVAEFLERESDRLAVTSVTSGRDALEIIGHEHVDCVVSDYDMPGIDGLDLLEAVRERDPDLPFVLFTGRGSEEVASEAISAGVTDYLQKEAGVGQYSVLANRIEHAVERRRTEGRLAESKRRFRRLLQNLPGMLYLCHNERGWPIVSVSAYCVQLTGYDASTLEEGSVSYGRDVIHPDDQNRVWEAVQSAVEAEEPFQVEYRIRTAEGEERRVWERGQEIETAVGESLLEGVVWDIAEHTYVPQRMDGSSFASR